MIADSNRVCKHNNEIWQERNGRVKAGGVLTLTGGAILAHKSIMMLYMNGARSLCFPCNAKNGIQHGTYVDNGAFKGHSFQDTMDMDMHKDRIDPPLNSDEAEQKHCTVACPLNT
jgi:hypothetical protein